ncbi:MAG: transposase [Myxococcota bacterium]
MTRPRIVEPGTVYALSRRTTRRYFLFNPDESRQMAQSFWYCLGVAANAHGVVVHAACLMSTHLHAVFTDVRGELPRFLHSFHRNLALCTKALRGWPEEVFNKRSSGAHALVSPEAIVEALAYLMANPVEASAVRYAKDWPGATTLPKDLGHRVVSARRPTQYFDSENPEWPDEVAIALEIPASLAFDYGKKLVQERVAERLRQRERRAWAEAKRSGIPFLGPRRVLKLSHSKRARSFEAFGSRNPQFAAAGNRRAAIDAVKRLRAFREQYGRALHRWMTGDRSARFPQGTWWMRVCHGARCGPAP